ncbi:unnamed protein product [Clonostachys rhizophaga]|uniref:Uncharacterized protein n=1 Tax=Clonostachys rhizophaga TaxID=160324 RepID=A0A9N9VXW2_9HYPO|nr:unnamed protein product [Clonostachys rhizophaga]
MLAIVYAATICSGASRGEIIYLTASLFLNAVTASDINCNGNVTIRNGEDAKNVRENCKTIAGNLDLDIFETCNLDGLEEVQGNVVHKCPTKQQGLDYCMDASTTFTISSSTLRSINGSLSFFHYRGVEKLDFPKLNKVRQEISLYAPYNLTHINFSNLEYFGAFSLNTPSLIELQLDKFKEFTSRGVSKSDGTPLGPYVNIHNTGRLESLDKVFQNPVNPYNTCNDGASNSFIDFHRLTVRNLTFGWTRIPSMTIEAQSQLTLTLGGPETEQMEFEGILEIGTGVSAINHHRKLKNLTVYGFNTMESAIIDLDLSFNQVASVIVYANPQLRQLRLPSMAQSWNNLYLTIQSNDNLLLSPTKNGSDETIWHWPTGDMSSVIISANITADFL